jgi:L-alanine-DL-glutamate epimerase-like enolase superfamily enzyme
VPPTTPPTTRSPVGPAVDGLEVRVYEVPTEQPEADGTLTWEATTVVAVLARSGTTTGLGWTYADRSAGQVVSGALAPVVTGRDAFDVPGANEAMTRAVRNAGRPGVAACAISAVDIALWDLKARLLDVALVHLLGRARESVPLYGSGGFTTFDDATTRRQVEAWLADDGVGAVKIKIGQGWGTHVERDLERVALVREVAGPGAGVFVDANGGYDVGQAVRVERRLRDLDVTWFEEPVSSDDLPGLARVRAQSLADVAAGEYGWTLGYFERMLAAGAVDCLQADVTRCGGITTWLRAAAVAEAHHTDVSAHCAPQLSAHVCCAVPNLRHLEWFSDHVRLEPMLFDGVLPATGGELRPDTARAGHGTVLRGADADRFRVG